MLKKTRAQIMDDFRAQVAAGKILVGVGVFLAKRLYSVISLV